MKPLDFGLYRVGSSQPRMQEIHILSEHMRTFIFLFLRYVYFPGNPFNQAHMHHILWNGALSSSPPREVAFFFFALIALCIYLMQYVSHRDVI